MSTKSIAGAKSNQPSGFEIKVLSCICGGEKLRMCGATETQVVQWFKDHEECDEKIKDKWPTRRR